MSILCVLEAVMDILIVLVGLLGLNATVLLMIGVAISDGVGNRYVSGRLVNWLMGTVLVVAICLLYGVGRIAWALVQ